MAQDCAQLAQLVRQRSRRDTFLLASADIGREVSAADLIGAMNPEVLLAHRSGERTERRRPSLAGQMRAPQLTADPLEIGQQFRLPSRIAHGATCRRS